MKIAVSLLLLALMLAATGCSEPEVILEGQRSDTRVPVKELMSTITEEEERAYREKQNEEPPGFFGRLMASSANVLPNWITGANERQVIRRGLRPSAPVPLQIREEIANANWTHRNGGPNHRSVHLALNPNFRLAWKTRIGVGNERRNEITTEPIVVGNRIFVMDSKSSLTSLSTSGDRIWSVSLVPQGENTTDAASGGLAFGGGVLFATTGFGYLHAINPENGRQYWKQFFGIAPYSAPTLVSNHAIVVTQDSKAWAVETREGRLKWTAFGAETNANLIGGASSAAWGRNAIIPFPSGEIISIDTADGSQNWSRVVAGRGAIQARNVIPGVTGDPVVDGDVVYASNQTGATSAFSVATGELLWTYNEGSYGPVWPEGDSVFLVTDTSRLNRLDSSNGRIIWSTPLPRYKTRRESKQAAVFAHFGPILAGGVLIVPSSDGNIRIIDPVSGNIVRTVPIEGGAASNPVVTSNTLYIVNQDGELLAYR